MKIIKRIGQWAVTKYGLETVDSRIGYEIHKSRLWEDWIPRMNEKRWVNMIEFVNALTIARTLHRKEW